MTPLKPLIDLFGDSTTNKSLIGGRMLLIDETNDVIFNATMLDPWLRLISVELNGETKAMKADNQMLVTLKGYYL